MGNERRNYSEEFKRKAVEHSLAPGKTATQVAKDLGINYSNLRRWRAEYKEKGELAFPGNGKQKLTPLVEENLRLKRELADVKEQRDILKKAVAIFSKKP